MAGMRLTVVGCSGSFPGPDSPASSYLLEAQGFRLVVDMGNGSLGALQRYVDMFEVDAICLSHLHADHCVDLASYWVAREYAPGGPLPRIPVYGPAGTAERVAGVLGSGHSGVDAVRQWFDVHGLTVGTWEIGPFRLTTERMNHPVETFGFRVEHAGWGLAYSADTGQTEALLRLAESADVLLCEASFISGEDTPPDLHLTARQAGEYAARAGAGQLVLTHLVPWCDRERSLAEAAGSYRGPLSAAISGLVLGPEAAG
jgi:ribonuclease BN (tRNA processing enzyme)